MLFKNSIFKQIISKMMPIITILVLTIASIPAIASKPCWLSNLNQDNQKNIYGIASTISASRLSPLHFAKSNAVSNWLLSEGLPPVSINEDLTDSAEYIVNDQVLYFIDQYSDKSAVYSLVSTKNDKPQTEQCEIQSCDVKQCNPSWLCSNNSDHISIIGISSAAGIKNDRIKHVISNAQHIAKLVNNVHVEGMIDLFHANDTSLSIANVQERYRITELNNKTSKVTVGEMCSHKGALLAQVILDKPNIAAEHNWQSQPNLGNVLGVVGHASGQTSTGRLSDLLNVAVKRGLFEMAKSKNINIKSDLKLEINNEGYYSLIRRSNQTTESIVSAYIADIKMQLNEKFQPEIYIWLLEN